jgi:hypothetical protein
MTCNNSHVKSEGEISTFEVREFVVFTRSHMLEKTFIIHLNEDDFHVKCTCALFELQGILCRHSISMLVTKKFTHCHQDFFLTDGGRI